MNTRTIVSKVSGVTFPEPTTGEDRQSIIALLTGDEPCRLVPEPNNPHDGCAIAVHIATSGGVKHCGYIPRELAKQLAPLLEGEAVMSDLPVRVRILEIVGGFEMDAVSPSSYGLRIAIDVPEDQPIERDV